jgi:hypothetical protein
MPRIKTTIWFVVLKLYILNRFPWRITITPFILFNFSLDYLSDSQVTQHETKIGMCQLFHHLTATVWSGVFLLPFMSSKLSVITLSIITSLVIQIGHRINKDYCWLTKIVNQTIDPNKPNRKWAGGDIGSLMKKYTHGDAWAYSDMRPPNNTSLITIMNVIHLFVLIKIIIKIK